VQVHDDPDYYRQRAEEEISAAMASGSTQIRKSHLELAHRYGELALALAERQHITRAAAGGGR
jgi:hypothetical protein